MKCFEFFLREYEIIFCFSQISFALVQVILNDCSLSPRLDRGGNRGEFSEISPFLDRGGNRGDFSEISPLFGQRWQQGHGFKISALSRTKILS